MACSKVNLHMCKCTAGAKLATFTDFHRFAHAKFILPKCQAVDVTPKRLLSNFPGATKFDAALKNLAPNTAVTL